MKRIAALLSTLIAMINVASAAVNINTATKEELAALSSIGPAKAQAIIDYRTKNGLFKTLAEVDKVPGVGTGTMAKIEKDVTLTNTTVTASTPPKVDPKAAPPAPRVDPKATANVPTVDPKAAPPKPSVGPNTPPPPKVDPKAAPPGV
jgi:competence protein ComEA